MTRIRLIAADIDGTLLDPGGALSPRTIQAVRAAHERGVIVALATSRRFTGAAPIAEALAAVDALILYDGALVRAYPRSDVLFADPLPAVLAQRVAETMAAHGLRPIAQYGHGDEERLRVAPAPNRAGWADAYLATAARQVEHVSLAELCAGAIDPLRLAAFGPLRRVRAVARAIAERSSVAEAIKAGSAVEFGTQVLPLGSYGAAELTVFALGASKGTALARLTETLKIPLAETLAIGDGVNDISMLRAAGLGVAMGNARRAVRQAADAATVDSQHDGAALAIERYVLGYEDTGRGHDEDGIDADAAVHGERSAAGT